MNDRDLGYLVGIVKCCDDVAGKLERFSINKRTWMHDRYLRDCVLMSIGTIGEYSRRLCESGGASHFPAIPWKNIKDMRNYIVHDYDNVDLDMAWDAVTDDVPALRKSLLTDVDVERAYAREREVFDDDIYDVMSSMDHLDLGTHRTCDVELRRARDEDTVR